MGAKFGKNVRQLLNNFNSTPEHGLLQKMDKIVTDMGHFIAEKSAKRAKKNKSTLTPNDVVNALNDVLPVKIRDKIFLRLQSNQETAMFLNQGEGISEAAEPQESSTSSHSPMEIDDPGDTGHIPLVTEEHSPEQITEDISGRNLLMSQDIVGITEQQGTSHLPFGNRSLDDTFNRHLVGDENENNTMDVDVQHQRVYPRNTQLITGEHSTEQLQTNENSNAQEMNENSEKNLLLSQGNQTEQLSSPVSCGNIIPIEETIAYYDNLEVPILDGTEMTTTLVPDGFQPMGRQPVEKVRWYLFLPFMPFS